MEERKRLLNYTTVTADADTTTTPSTAATAAGATSPPPPHHIHNHHSYHHQCRSHHHHSSHHQCRSHIGIFNLVYAATVAATATGVVDAAVVGGAPIYIHYVIVELNAAMF